MTLTFQKERFSTLLLELPQIFREHWEDIAGDKDKIALDPGWDRYMQYDGDGTLHIMTARDGSYLAGYFFAMVYPHLHYKTSLTACSDMFYLRAQYRKDLGAYARLRGLIRASVKMCSDLKVQKIYISHKLRFDLSRLLEREGFKHVDIVHAKLL